MGIKKAPVSKYLDPIRSHLIKEVLLNSDYIDASNEEKVKILLNFIINETRYWVKITTDVK